MSEIQKLRCFIQEMTELVARAGACSRRPSPSRTRSTIASTSCTATPYTKERFPVVGFVWGPGQETPVHDHTVWGLIGMLRVAELCQPFEIAADGSLRPGPQVRLTPGRVTAVPPRLGDVHRVCNAHDDRVSISIHVYGANIGAVGRQVTDVETGAPKAFVSGYSSALTPNLRDRAAEVRAGLGCA